jgi:hypothetical protein
MERLGHLVYDQCNIRWQLAGYWSAQYGEAVSSAVADDVILAP